MNKLNEAIQVDGAIFIDSAKGFDLFDITTWAAAQEFENDSDNVFAGESYVQSETTFNDNINEHQHLYFFVRENTNKVVAAVVKGSNTSSRIGIKNLSSSLIIHTNYQLENCDNHQSEISDLNIPLYLIPGATHKYSNMEVDPANGIAISDGDLQAVVGCLCRSSELNELNLEHCRRVVKNAFTWGVSIGDIILSPETEIPNKALRDTTGRIKVKAFEKPENWPADWNAGVENRTEFNYGFTADEIAEHQAQLAAEAERLEREAREKEEQERLAAEREARKLRYKVEGNNITILGTRKGVTELEIPAEVDGKPVTKIASYAFYGNQDLRSLRIADDCELKLIEQGAFANCPNLRAYLYVPSDCIIGKYSTMDSPHVRIVKKG